MNSWGVVLVTMPAHAHPTTSHTILAITICLHAVHYTGTLEDGTKFDSSVDRGDPLSFSLGQGQVIKGWDAVVATMKKGEKVVATLAPEYAYGASGSPPTIPPNATLVRSLHCHHCLPVVSARTCVE